MIPNLKIEEWLNEEKKLGSPNPDRIILSTSTKDAIPHSRIVAIREILDDKIIFFTQRDTRKVSEMLNNPHVSMAIWLPIQQRQIIIEGLASPITEDENLSYWKTMPRDQQLRFSAYAPTSGQCIDSNDQLEDQYQHLARQYSGMNIPHSNFYKGFQVSLDIVYFYTLGTTNFSEYTRAKKVNDSWIEESLSP